MVEDNPNTPEPEGSLLERELAALTNPTPEEQLAALQQSLAEAREEASQNLDSAQRSQAEFANYRRRSDEERLAQQKYSNSRLISKILPMMEDLDLALAHAANDSEEATAVGATWLEGVKLIQRKFASLLESEGVTVIESVGAPFNPLEHEALGTQESTVHSPGYVTQTVRRGYRLHDRIIQPAQVIVAREPQDPGYNNGENKESDNG